MKIGSFRLSGGLRYDGKHFYWDPKKIEFSRKEIKAAWRKVMTEFYDTDKGSKVKKPKTEQEKPPKQPFYCQWQNGEWDRKFRDKNGNEIKYE
ncbi:MAG: hypothetical protein WCT49_06010 [Candidatus Paceibacterota bacterium]|jgi:hypothetical protein|nr:hypothetical protein [Candidatus Paceibacterota bacterium]